MCLLLKWKNEKKKKHHQFVVQSVLLVLLVLMMVDQVGRRMVMNDTRAFRASGKKLQIHCEEALKDIRQMQWGAPTAVLRAEGFAPRGMGGGRDSRRSRSNPGRRSQASTTERGRRARRACCCRERATG